MAESQDNAAKSAEEAYAAAAAEPKPAASELPKAAPTASTTPAPRESAPADERVVAEPKADEPAPKRKSPVRKAKSATRTPAAKKPVSKATPARNVTRKLSAPKRAAARKGRTPAPAASEQSISELKEKIMATAKTTDFTQPMTDAMSEVQARTQAALEKSTALATEMTEFSKGNVEAFVESGKVLAGGMQDLGKTYVDEARTAYEAMTADMKEMASVKSPTELLQLQANLARRNFDTMFAYGSKNGEAMMKLMSEAFAPISSRMNLAAEKISKAA